MLQPRKVRIARWRRTVFPAWVFIAYACVPFLHVKGRVGHDVIGAQIWVLIIGVGAGGFFAEVKINAADRHIHGGELPCGVVVFLPIDGDITDFAFMRVDEMLGLHKEAARSHGGVVNAAFEGL